MCFGLLLFVNLLLPFVKQRNTDEEPVNDDTVVDEDGKADEPNQVRKNKRGRGNKVNSSLYNVL